MQDVLNIVKSVENSGVLLKGVTETIHNDISEKKDGFLLMLLGTLGASLYGDLLTKNLSGKETVRAGEGIEKSSNSTTSLNKF